MGYDMRLNVTRSATSILYSAILYFHCIIFALGMVESTFSGYELMKVISPTTAIISLLIAGVLATIKKVSLYTKKYCIAIATVAALCFLFIQFSFLFHMQVNFDLGSLDNNPFTLSLYAIFMFTCFSAITIKAFHKNIKINEMKKIKLVVFIVVLIGSTVWHQSSLNLVRTQDANAREKIHLLETMINRSLASQKKALARIKTRVEKVSFEDFMRLINIDSKNYISDYNIIKGVLVLDNELNYISGDNFSSSFYLNGMLEKPTIKLWLKRDKEEVQFAANSLTLDSDIPILMFLAPVKLANQSRFYILNLLDMNLLLEKSYLKYLSRYDTYLELTPNVYFSVDYKNKTQSDLNKLTSRYNHFITEKINVMGLVEHNVYTFINDYEAIHIDTIIDQLILWFTFLFIFIFVLVADSSRALEFSTKHDELTGLLRLKALEEEFLQLSSVRGYSNFATVIVKLDFYEEIHNSLGYEISDKILKKASERISINVDNRVLISKGINDSFVLYFTDTTPAILEQKIEALILDLSKAYCIDTFDFNLTASAGVVFYQTPELFNFKLNLQQANIALEKSTELGGNQIHFYQQIMDDKHSEKIIIRNNLHTALKNNELEVFYQPIHNLNGNQIVGVEALVRWCCNGEWISPAKFIPVAETTGQIVQVGKQVLNQVLHDIKKHSQLQNITVAVNFSTKQIIKDNFSIDLLHLLTQNNITYKNFTVEVTESSFQEKTSIEKTLLELINSGLNVAIDDFGTGFSSLSYLANQPANIIKIDREFTLGADKDTKERKLLDTIIKVCYDLGKKVVVEGVEDEKLITHLSRYKGIRIQGYFFSKPLPIDHLIEYIRVAQYK